VKGAGGFATPGARPERSGLHAEAVRQAALELIAARRAGDDRAARRHLAKLRRALDAHIEGIRAERSRLS